MLPILHVIPCGDPTAGGLAYASLRLAHEQARSALRTFVFEIDATRRDVSYGWLNRNVHYIEPEYKSSFLKKIARFYNFVRSKNLIIHFHGVWLPTYFPFFMIALLLNKKYVISPHGSFEKSALNQSFHKKSFVRIAYLNFVITKSVALWACSFKESSSIHSHFPDKEIQVIPIGIDLPFPPVDCFHCDNSGFEKEIKTILVIARLEPIKGLLNLIRAWNLIRDKSWRIVIAGPDRNCYQRELEREISKLQLSDYFTFLGYVDSQFRDKLYREADLFVLPSLSENFGIVIIEALSYGVPVLTTHGTPWSYVGLERGCLCVDVFPSALANGLRTLMKMSDYDRYKMCLAAREFVAANFTWSSIIDTANKSLQSIS